MVSIRIGFTSVSFVDLNRNSKKEDFHTLIYPLWFRKCVYRLCTYFYFSSFFNLTKEQLDGAGIELPSLFKWIDSQAPNGCSTEAWKKRTHWVGSQITCEITTSVAEAEKHLQAIRPVRR